MGDGFHTWHELLIINLSVFFIALLLTTLKWGVHFYQNWKLTESHLKDSNHKLSYVKSEIDKSTKQIDLIRGNAIFKVDITKVNYAKTEQGVVWVVYSSNKKGVFMGTLQSLNELLPKHLFFQATRNQIIHKNIIRAISSSTYGKIEVQLTDSISDEDIITVSRPKAASFRKWYHSTSTPN